MIGQQDSAMLALRRVDRFLREAFVVQGLLAGRSPYDPLLRQCASVRQEIADVLLLNGGTRTAGEARGEA